MRISGRTSAAAGIVLIVVLFAVAASNRPADPLFEGKFASHWCAELLNSNPKVREDAQEALSALGEKSVPQLRALLRRRNGPWEKPLVRLDSLLPFLNYSPVNADLCRVSAAQMFARLGAKGSAAADDLVSSFKFEGSAGESERALLRIGDCAIAALEGGVLARNARVRVRSARLLREFGSAGESSIHVLVRATRDESSEVRREAALSIGELIGNRNGECCESSAIESVVVLSGDREIAVRAAAMVALRKIGSNDLTVLSSLRRGLADEAIEVRLEAAKSLWTLLKASDEILPVLVSILETPERWRAAYVLGDMGADAAPAVPALIHLLLQERVPRPFRTPASSALALGKIGAAAVPQLSRALENNDSRVRMNALMALNFMGPAGGNAVPQLMKLLKDQNAEVRHTTALTLANIGAEPNEIIAGLTDCLHAEDIYMRSAAAAHLRKIAPEQNWIVPTE